MAEGSATVVGERKLTANHWGVGLAQVANGQIRAVVAHPDDPHGSPINKNIAGSLAGRARILRPAIRESWLEGRPRAVARGRDSFVEVSWDRALDLVAQELTRVREVHGNDGIFAGSYGWSSAGRFHHAQSQLKRFLNCIGGFVRSEGNYSYNAALVMMPYIVGPFRAHVAQATRWPVIARHSDLVVMFGGIALRNTQVSDGGVARHRMADNFKACAEAGVKFVNISPLRSDAGEALGADWLPAHPGSDTALMLGLAHVLHSEGLHDRGFLDRYTTGFDRFEAYLTGAADGVPKTAEWAAEKTGLSAERIRDLARRMAAGRCMISVAAGVQRTDYGEQPLWMAVTLAAMLGQIGLPGGGYTVGYGVNANIGNIERLFRWGTLPQGRNPVDDIIPVAMISEMLLRPGGDYTYRGETRRLPDARLVWWAGGNPFHHHQDLMRLHRAFQTPETVIVNDINWTAAARHADIVLPVAAAQERRDFGAGKSDNALVPMHPLTAPPGEARVEYDIYCDLASRMLCGEAFSEGRTSEDWLRAIWDQTRETAAAHGQSLPTWEAFMAGDIVTLPDPSPEQVFLAEFRADPVAHPLPTPSGRIELFSDRIASFDLPDCPGHAAWFPPRDLEAGEGDFYLLSGQPKTRLHSQLDNGAYSLSHKIEGREPVLIHPDDAAALGIADGDVVELYNSRGRCLAGARVTDEIRQGCVFLWTGAWWDPDFDAPQGRDRHGNPNALTHDLRTSSLSQSPAAHSARISIRRFEGTLPEITVHDPPPLSSAQQAGA
ncbi:molybdopterin-dependent oxidoreductase [Roseobacter sinensis]|uniref:Molybdopterin-dependent oxidoreductase n=1 Tax=Roseobacter sinensis TaxID=2931391 RepID=A0ABT3BKT7_9RHOB|nr:molybdopterin-dependent oxidoreductase [Roseobacter sp. WL0113]MCV3274188.1 molybdopterin-dependent oxidoreductase [Roseobacter sp. WL0113]